MDAVLTLVFEQFAEPTLRWLDANIAVLLGGLIGTVLVSVRGLIARYLSGRAAWFAEQVLVITANRIGDAIQRGLAQSRAATEADKVADAVAYAKRTTAQTIARHGITDAELVDRALAEARGGASSTSLSSF